MLKVERLECENTKFHKNCRWINVAVTYPDANFLMLKDRLIREVRKTNIAYRILHHRFGVLTTIKMGHDDNIYIQENEDAQKRFALAPEDIATWLR